MRPVSLLRLGSALCLAGCVAPGEYPSLQPRAFELAARNVATPPPPAPAEPAKPEVVARAAALLAQGREGQRAFVAELAAARPVIARAGGAASESWITAQEQLSGLEASRTPTVSATAELDALARSGVDPSGLRFGEGDLAVLRAASDELGALLDAQGREIAALAATLAEPI